MKNKSLSLYSKITLAFGLLFLVLAFSIAMTLWQTQRTGIVVSHLVDQQMPITRISLQLQNGVTNSLAAMRGILLTNGEVFKKNFNDTWLNDITPNLATLKTMAQSHDDSFQVKVNALSSQLSQLRSYQESIIALSITDKTKAISEFTTRVSKIVFPLMNQLQSLVDNQTKSGIQSAANVKQSLWTLTILEWILLTAGLVLAILISRKLAGSISKPVIELADSADTIANGEVIKKINVRGVSEIEHLAASFNKMQDIMVEITNAAKSISKGDYTLHISPRCKDDELIFSLQDMTNTLAKNKHYFEEQSWLQKGINQLVETVAKNTEVRKLCTAVLAEICRYLDAGAGAIYLYGSKTGKLRLYSSFAYTEREFLANEFKLGDGIVGQVGFEKKAILLKNIKRQNLVITTSLTEEPPINVYAFPLTDKNELVGVVELAFHENILKLKMDYLDRISPLLASNINVSQQKKLTEKLLTEQQKLTEELQTQQEELKASNEELEAQAEELKTSEEELRMRDEEQRTLNLELEDRNKRLENQTDNLKQAQEDLVAKSRQVQQSSQYKSEFLANMSHELRTPLNSLLILSNMLSENEEGNLTEDQLESIKVIHRSGGELLQLINDILDIAKVEAGKLSIQHGEIRIRDFLDEINADFKPVAQKKNLDFSIELEENFIEKMVCDEQRLKQIIKNLLSNAFKFTEKGSVKLHVHRVPGGIQPGLKEKDPAKLVAWSIIDTGTGIPEDKQKQVFDTFYQLDGSSSRTHGGAGLGLAISTQLSELLDGEIRLESEIGKGSTFTLYLPIEHGSAGDAVNDRTIKDADSDIKPSRDDVDIKSVADGSHAKKLLVIEDDVQFAKILMGSCAKKGYDCLHAADGKTGIEFAVDKQPTAILLDLNLPDMNGMEVADELKQNEHTKNIPIHFISGDDRADEAMKHGAAGYLMKPISIEKLDSAIQGISKALNNNVNRLLVIEDDAVLGQQIKKIFESKGVSVTHADSGQKALELLKNGSFDFMVLDLGLPDISGFDLLQQIHGDSAYSHPAIIVYTGRELTEQEHQLLQKYSNSIIVKSQASMQRLLDEASLFLHQVEKNLNFNTPIRQMLAKSDIKFDGQKLLLVDDDMRNSFALATALKKYGLKISIAPNGKAAMDTLNKDADFDGVLMDIMMPVMDGYEAIEKIRKISKFTSLPIIALTAKTMPADREKCLQVGATDYLPKPVDVNKLLILLKARICQ